jgi:hypothetical protein
MNVLTIFRTRNIVKKFAWKILNVSTVYWVGIRQVHCPCTHDVFTMYRAGKPGFDPSVFSVGVHGVQHLVHLRLELVEGPLNTISLSEVSGNSNQEGVARTLTLARSSKSNSHKRSPTAEVYLIALVEASQGRSDKGWSTAPIWRSWNRVDSW